MKMFPLVVVPLSSFVVLLIAPALTDAAKVRNYPLPAYVEKACKRSDPKMDECLVEVGTKVIKKIIKGDSKYRIPPIDPFIIPEIKVDHGGKQMGLSFVCTNCALNGLQDAVFNHSETDLNKRFGKWTFLMKNIQIFGKYKVNGKVLLLPITGQGNADVNLKDMTFTYSLAWDLVKKSNGLEYIKVKNFTALPDVGGMSMKLENLFNGDKILGDNMNVFLNENWKELVREFGPAVAEAMGQILTSILNSICELIPYETLFPV